ncbi:hypothetical protein UlMin_033225 [Ulmus minor]
MGLVTKGAIGGIVGALVGGSPNCLVVATTMLTSLVIVEVNKATNVAHPYVIRALKKEAGTTCYAICSFLDNRRRPMQCGSVPILLRIADSGLNRAVEVLGLLAKCKEGREEMERFNGSVRILVRVLRNESSRGIQYALLTLNPLCLYSEEICGVASREGVLEICMRLLDDENEKIRITTSNSIQVLIGNHLMR